MSDPEAPQDPVGEETAAATDAPDQTATIPEAADAPPVPSPTAVPGWSQGVDGNWWPPSPSRERPPEPPPPHKYRKFRGRRFAGALGTMLFVAVVVGLVGVIVYVIKDFEDTKPATPTVTSPAHSAGETARTASFDVTLNSAQDPSSVPNLAQTPAAGFHFVSADLTIANVSDKDTVISAQQLISLVDAAGNRQEQVATPGVDSIEGLVAAHDSRHGIIVFTVPDSAGKPLTLRVKGEVNAGGVTFGIS